ncbi:MAG: light-harvesting protein [Flavimaricola sp.]|nr:light-harvesting protein [Flavimaricola sp.]
MNNARMRLVVSPTIGIQLFLGPVAVGSFSDNMQVVRNSPPVKDVLQGVSIGIEGQMGSAAMLDKSG